MPAAIAACVEKECRSEHGESTKKSDKEDRRLNKGIHRHHRCSRSVEIRTIGNADPVVSDIWQKCKRQDTESCTQGSQPSIKENVADAGFASGRVIQGMPVTRPGEHCDEAKEKQRGLDP
jgi:hypothetical protein